MRSAIRLMLDYAVEHPVQLYGLPIVLGVLAGFFLPPDLLKMFVKNSFSAIPGVAFSLFGFAITAISILVSLKGSAFFELLQQTKMSLWKSLIGAFVQEAGIYAAFGLFTLIFSSDQLIGYANVTFKISMSVYCGFFLATIAATVCAVYLLRLVANAPIVIQRTPTQVDPSALNNLRNQPPPPTQNPL